MAPLATILGVLLIIVAIPFGLMFAPLRARRHRRRAWRWRHVAGVAAAPASGSPA